VLYVLAMKELATWTTVEASIRAALHAGGPDVVVERARGSAAEWVVIRTRICAESDMEPSLVLERNGRLAFAVMVLLQGSYWLRVSIPLDSTELDDPQQLVALLIDAAGSLSPIRMIAASFASDAFQHYAS